MYSVKQYLIVFLLLFCATLSLWLAFKLPAPSSTTPALPETQKSYMTDVVITRMNPDSGKPQDELQTPLMVHYEGKTTITQPHFIIFQINGQQPWNLSGDHGETQSGMDILNLWGNVVLAEAPGPQNQAMTITTSAVTIYPKKKYAETVQPVVGSQPGNVLQAIGMHTDFKTGIVTLLSNVRGKSQ